MPILLAPSCNDSTALLALATWLGDAGAWLSPKMHISCSSISSSRGIAALDTVEHGEDIARVPLSLLMTNEAALSDDVELRDMVERNAMSSTNVAAVALLRQRQRNRRWRPFAGALPSEINTTLWWSEDELAELQLSELAVHTSMRASAVHRHHGTLHAVMPHEEVPPLDDFKWALSTVWARGHSVPAGHGHAGKQACLAPLLDLFNADFASPSVEAARLVGSELVVRARRTLYRNEEATIPYGDGGPLSNARALFDYGFCVQDNPHDDVDVPLSATACTGGTATQGMLAALQLLPPTPPPRLRRVSLGTNALGRGAPVLSLLPPELNAFARVCTMAPPTIAATRDAAARGTDRALHARLGQALRRHASEDLSAISFLASYLRRRVASYASSATEDQALLRQCEECGMRRRCAILLRLSEKRILEDYAAALEDHPDSHMQIGTPPAPQTTKDEM